MIDAGVAATDIAVYVATVILGYVGLKAREIQESQSDLSEDVEELNEKLDKHDFILFGDDDISGYNGIQVVSYTNRAYLKQHHDALVEEDMIEEDASTPTVTPDIEDKIQR
ncbi:hypothetical protein [Natrarchaeobaculum sulfurireducens]|uniref:Uncharacterized protein n=1 Tax=Natrarchaeobaculum sulfurireducens TaxID=2044521 RepID=A0A346PPQ4_9EURY|nr:hypothetical protein [Natrarchaeobaculum sulfurireducens]AXR81499.1 hypothetical protein AArcMg_1486 [Natrarchaeobaculum sulfurireducens]